MYAMAIDVVHDIVRESVNRLELLDRELGSNMARPTPN